MVDENEFAQEPVVFDAGGKARLEFTLSLEGLPAGAKPVVGLFADDGSLVGRTEVSGTSSFEKAFQVSANPKDAPNLKFSVYDSASSITVDSFLGSCSANFKTLLDNLESKCSLFGNDKKPNGASLVVTKKAKPKKEKKADKSKDGKKEKPAAALSDKEKAKLLKNALKEGGKKGQDICGLSDMGGVKFFHVSVESPEGDWELMDKVFEGFNLEVDESAEDRKGGAGGLGKVILSYNDDKLIWICHLPEEIQKEKNVDIKAWNANVIEVTGGSVVSETPTVIKGEAKANPDANKYSIKMRDEAINRCYIWLQDQKLVLADDSDDDIAYGDDDFPDYYGEEPKEEAAAPAASTAVLFADVDAGKTTGQDQFKTYSNDTVLGKVAPSLDSIEYLPNKDCTAPTANQIKVILFWGQYHKPGYKFLPMYSELQKKYADKVGIVGVSMDPDTSYATKFLEDPAGKYSTVFPCNFAMAWDKDSTLKKSFMDASGIKTLSPPHCYVIDASGTIVWHQDHSELGATAPSYVGLLESQLDLLVAGKPVANVGDRAVEEEDEEEEDGEFMDVGGDDDDDEIGGLAFL